MELILFVFLYFLFKQASTRKFKVAVIGGGAAGFFSAIHCATGLKQKTNDFEVIYSSI
jgi:hypothetical protein